MVRRFGGRVRFAVENYGASPLAERFGVTRYPAIFVDDILVAKPKDFGFYGKGEGAGEGRYTPWRDARNHERFRQDLARVVEMALAGRGAEARAELGRSTAEDPAPARLPEFSLTGLDGAPIDSASLEGKATLVEFWATWCPPCRGTLQWLGELRRRHGDRLQVVALAIESDEADVRRLQAELDLPISWAMGSPDVARQFGDIAAVPTLLLFAPDGRTREIFYGAPPDLHQRVEAALGALLPDARPQGSAPGGGAAPRPRRPGA